MKFKVEVIVDGGMARGKLLQGSTALSPSLNFFPSALEIVVSRLTNNIDEPGREW